MFSRQSGRANGPFVRSSQGSSCENVAFLVRDKCEKNARLRKHMERVAYSQNRERQCIQWGVNLRVFI